MSFLKIEILVKLSILLLVALLISFSNIKDSNLDRLDAILDKENSILHIENTILEKVKLIELIIFIKPTSSIS